MSEKLLQHKHCRHCGKAINVKDEFCDDSCRTTHMSMLRSKRNQLYILMAIAIGLMIMTLFLGGS